MRIKGKELTVNERMEWQRQEVDRKKVSKRFWAIVLWLFVSAATTYFSVYVYNGLK